MFMKKKNLIIIIFIDYNCILILRMDFHQINNSKNIQIKS